MNYQQPTTTSTSTNIEIPEGMRNVGDNISNSFQKMTSNINESMQGFSEQASASIDTGTEVSNDFLTTNTLFAKFAFIILIVIVFMFLLSLGVLLLNYFFGQSDSPYLVKGMLDGDESTTIAQDPINNESVLVSRSNNKSNGMEFTWSTWIYINELNSGPEYKMYRNIFNKGNKTYDVEGISTVSNGPGLYLKQMTPDADTTDVNTASLFMIMDSKTGRENNHENSLEIKDVPLKKWVNVIMRMKNTVKEAYINGVVSGRLQFREMPMQNYYDVHVCQNGGFNGKISNLRYYSEALTIFDINNIVSAGPDLRKYKLELPTTTTFNYLSNMWYTNKLY